MNAILPSELRAGSRVMVITKAKFRYEGIVVVINALENTMTLKNVRFMGSLKNVANELPECTIPQIGSTYESITFWMKSVLNVSSLDPPSRLVDSAVKDANGARTQTRMVPRTAISYPRRAIPFEQDDRLSSQQFWRQPFGKRRRNTFTINGNQPRYNTSNGFVRRTANMLNRRLCTAQVTEDFEGGIHLHLPPDVGGPRRYPTRRRDRTTITKILTPYDYVTENVKLTKFLEELDIKDSNSSIQSATLVAEREADAATSTGDDRTTENTDSQTNLASGNGASGDSPSCPVTSTIESGEVSGQNSSGNAYYNAEKSFFDKISRSEGGPRGKPEKSNRVPTIHVTTNENTSRRDRKLNRITFGRPETQFVQGIPQGIPQRRRSDMPIQA